ncbi:ferredoxin [Prosthecobacter fusiformis]|uniref:Ferredoxin n=1 Tax=Prosthecobacter fusiformis TaxID=48464 RepID=A0A4R7SU73_9BACT|nr:ferredoxin [Prosthecobacter fusiformis]TDU81867.1 ferredoxin [Prosthecobacter fusiformis]
MADITDKIPQNTEGRFYVDSTCIDCDQCRSTAPEFFKRDDDEATSYVWRQPVTEDEINLCIEAMEGCPSESIGG